LSATIFHVRVISHFFDSIDRLFLSLQKNNCSDVFVLGFWSYQRPRRPNWPPLRGPARHTKCCGFPGRLFRSSRLLFAGLLSGHPLLCPAGLRAAGPDNQSGVVTGFRAARVTTIVFAAPGVIRNYGFQAGPFVGRLVRCLPHFLS
jgi:hypothetical protein